MLYDQHTNCALRSPQRHAQPRSRGAPAFLDFAALIHLFCEFRVNQHGPTSSQHVAAKAYANRPRFGTRIELVDPKRKMHQLGGFIVERDKAIFCVEVFSNCMMSKFEKLIQVRSRDRALDDFSNSFSFSFHSLTLGEIQIDGKHTDGLLISNDRHPVELHWD